MVTKDKTIHRANDKVRTHYLPEKRSQVSVHPQLVYSGTVKRSPLWQEQLHTHEFLEIMFISQGKGTVEIDGTSLSFTRGDILVYNMGIAHCESSDPSDPFESHFFAAKNIRLGRLNENCLIPSDASPVVHAQDNYDVFKVLFEQLIKESADIKAFNREITESILRTILYSLLRIFSYGDYKKINLSFLNAKSYIDNNFASINSVDDLCNRLYLSKYYLSHLFKEYANTTPLQYLIEKKITLAKKLLKDTCFSIKEISVKCGYNDTGYFHKVFKQQTGTTPAGFRHSQN